MSTRLIVLLFFVSCLAGIGGYLIGKQTQVMPSTQYETLRDQEDDLISPLIDVDIPESVGEGSLSHIIDVIQDDAHSFESQTVVDVIGIYYRDLKEGSWYGYNEQEQFAPASLLKVPLMLAYYKLAETQPTLLTKKMAYDDSYPLADQNTSMDFQPQHAIQKGNTYTVAELLRYMIVYSDNNAKNLLYLNITQDQMNDVYRDLGMTEVVRATNPIDDVLSPRDNATAYRVLYNATYLTPSNSRSAIKLLLGDTFRKGVIAGLPKGVRYAGKYGERSFGGTRQLHDCGIVYYPKHPYIICIMTRGSDYGVLSGALKKISADIYKAVDASHHSSR